MSSPVWAVAITRFGDLQTCDILHFGKIYRWFKKVPVNLLGTRFEARNYISEPGPQEAYRDIFNHPVLNRKFLIRFQKQVVQFYD
jgi:hypothetical protein